MIREDCSHEDCECSDPCPTCDEPNHVAFDCELFGCRSCRKIICDNCAFGGVCPGCDGKQNGTITIVFTG